MTSAAIEVGCVHWSLGAEDLCQLTFFPNVSPLFVVVAAGLAPKVACPTVLHMSPLYLGRI